MKERREKRKRWVQRGQYAVEVEVEVIYPAADPTEPCLEPATVHRLDEIAQRAAQGAAQEREGRKRSSFVTRLLEHGARLGI